MLRVTFPEKRCYRFRSIFPKYYGAPSLVRFLPCAKMCGAPFAFLLVASWSYTRCADPGESQDWRIHCS
jgi:hypothetical protein